MLRKEKGITLVALIITVIVLLILAGITLAMVVGDNGIITRTRKAKYETMTSEAVEKMQLAVAAAQMEIQQQEIYDGSYVMTAKKLSDVLKADGIDIQTANAGTDDANGDGWAGTATDDTTAFTSVTVTYAPAEYAKTGANGTAKITFTITQSNGNLSVTHNALDGYNS